MRNTSNARRRDKHFPFLLATLLFVALVLASVLARHEVVSKNVYAFGVPLGGLTRDKAEAIVREKAREFEGGSVTFAAGDRSVTVSSAEIKLLLDDDSLVEDLEGAVSSRSRLLPSFLSRLGTKVVIAAPAIVISPDANESVLKIAKALSAEPTGTHYEFSGRDLIVAQPKAGQTVTSEDVSKALLGVSGDRIEVDFTPIEALPASDLPPLSLTGEFATPFDTAETDRNVNLTLAAATFHGKALQPGETYSFNNTAGERTAAKGYRYANVVVGDHLEPGLAGGICQVTTTLFNAAVSAGLSFPEVHAHGIPVQYVPPGTDAAVEWGYLDLKIKNTTDGPVVFGAWVEDGEVAIRVFGKPLNKTYELLPVTVATYPEPPKEPGLTVETWVIEKENGQEVGRKMLVRSYYLPHVKVVK